MTSFRRNAFYALMFGGVALVLTPSLGWPWAAFAALAAYAGALLFDRRRRRLLRELCEIEKEEESGRDDRE